MPTLDLGTVVVEYGAEGPIRARLETDRPGESSIHPTVEAAICDSDAIARLCSDDAEDRDVECGLFDSYDDLDDDGVE